jgi:Ca2+-binding EF-hand superfamily protein
MKVRFRMKATSTAPRALICAVLGGSLVACGASQKRGLVGQTDAPLEDPEPRKPPEDEVGSQAYQYLLDQFDENDDGKLQVSELPPRMLEHLDGLDADGDGVVSVEELREAFLRVAKAHFKAMDTDGDGRLTKEEVGPRWKFLVKADEDEDGAVTFDEVKAAFARGHFAAFGAPPNGRGMFAGHGPGCAYKLDIDELIEHYDRNGDGALEFDELPDRKVDWLAAADVNRDGVLSRQELLEFEAAQQAKRFAEMDEDGDGFLTEEEVGRRRWKHISRADADGDGKVSSAELDAVRKTGALCRPERGGGDGFRGRPHGKHGSGPPQGKPGRGPGSGEGPGVGRGRGPGPGEGPGVGRGRGPGPGEGRGRGHGPPPERGE